MKLGCAFKFYVQIYSAEASSAFVLLYNDGVHSTRPDAPVIHGQGCQGDEKLQMAPKLSHACKRWAMEKLQQGVSKDVILLENRERLLKQYGAREVGERQIKAVLMSPGARDFLLNRKDLNNFEKKLKEGRPELGVDSIEAARQLTRAARALVVPGDGSPRGAHGDGIAHELADDHTRQARPDPAPAFRPRASGSDTGDMLAEAHRAAFGRPELEDRSVSNLQGALMGEDAPAAFWQRHASQHAAPLSHPQAGPAAAQAGCSDPRSSDVAPDAAAGTHAGSHRSRSLRDEARELAALMTATPAAARMQSAHSIPGGTAREAPPASAPAATQVLSDGSVPHPMDLWASTAPPNELSDWTSQLYASLFPVLSTTDAWHAPPSLSNPSLLRLSQTSLPSLLIPRSDAAPSLRLPEERQQLPLPAAPALAPAPPPAPLAGGATPPTRLPAPSSSNASDSLHDAASAVEHWQRLRKVLRRSFDDWLDRMHDHVVFEAGAGRVTDLDCAHAAYADVKAWHHMAPWARRKHRPRKFRAPANADGAGRRRRPSPARTHQPSASPSVDATADSSSSGGSSMCSSSDDEAASADCARQPPPPEQQQQQHLEQERTAPALAPAPPPDCVMRPPEGQAPPRGGDGGFKDIVESEEAMAAVATMCALAEDARRGVQAIPQRGPLSGFSDKVATQILCATAERVRHATFAANPSLVDLHHKHLRLQKELFKPPAGSLGGTAAAEVPPTGLSPRMVQAAISLHANNLCEVAQTIAAAPM